MQSYNECYKHTNVHLETFHMTLHTHIIAVSRTSDKAVFSKTGEVLFYLQQMLKFDHFISLENGTKLSILNRSICVLATLLVKIALH